MTHLLRLDAEELHSILQKPSFRVFSHHIHNYGRWMRLKVALIMSISSASRKKRWATRASHRSSSRRPRNRPRRTASAFGDSSSDEGGALRRQAAFVVERLAGVLAAAHLIIRGRGREALDMAAAALAELAAAASALLRRGARHGPLRPAVDLAAGGPGTRRRRWGGPRAGETSLEDGPNSPTPNWYWCRGAVRIGLGLRRVQRRVAWRARPRRVLVVSAPVVVQGHFVAEERVVVEQRRGRPGRCGARRATTSRRASCRRRARRSFSTRPSTTTRSHESPSP